MKRIVIDNPRYPHHIRIIRKVVKDWLDDASSSSSSSSSNEEEQELVVYDGIGRSYTDTTTTGDAKVDSNKRKASIPVRFDEWVSADTVPCCCAEASSSSDAETSSSDDAEPVEPSKPLIPMSGDILYVTKGSISEEWEVKDFEPDNDRSVVYGELNRNFNIE